MDFPFVKQAISQLFSKPSCDMYPFVPSEAAPNYRGRIAYDPNKCIGCGMCVRVCAGKAITLTREPVEGGENITPALSATPVLISVTSMPSPSPRTIT